MKFIDRVKSILSCQVQRVSDRLRCAPSVRPKFSGTHSPADEDRASSTPFTENFSVKSSPNLAALHEMGATTFARFTSAAQFLNSLSLSLSLSIWIGLYRSAGGLAEVCIMMKPLSLKFVWPWTHLPRAMRQRWTVVCIVRVRKRSPLKMSDSGKPVDAKRYRHHFAVGRECLVGSPSWLA